VIETAKLIHQSETQLGLSESRLGDRGEKGQIGREIRHECGCDWARNVLILC
jgi:hypothetical protein